MKKNIIKFFIIIFLIICIFNINNTQCVDNTELEQQQTNIQYEGSQTNQIEKQEITQNIETKQTQEITQNIETKQTQEAKKTIQNGTYTISTAMNSNLVLDISGASIKDGVNVLLYKKNGQNNQKFNITYLENGYYKIEVVNSGKYLSAPKENGKNEDKLVQTTYNEEKATQQWIIKEAGDGYYYIISKDSFLYLDVYREEAKNGSNIILYEGKGGNNQRFKFNKVNTITGTKTIENGIYTISSAQDFNKVLDVNNASQSNSANIELYTRNVGKNQQFKVEYLKNGYYTIQAVHSNKYLTVKNSSTQKGANVEQYEDLQIDAQKWVIKSAGNGYYYIISKCNNLYLDLQGGLANSGTNIDVYEPNYNNWQKFKFYEMESDAKKTVEEGNYVIVTALNTNKVIDVEGDVITDKANIEIWDNNNGNNQKFILTYLEDGYYTIKAFNSNKVLTIENSSALSGANVVQSYYKELDSQKWAIKSAGDGYYYLVSKYSNMVLDIQGATSTNGSNIEVYEKNGEKNQKFKFVKTDFSATIANGKYAILASSNNNKALDVINNSLEDGAKLNLWESNGGSNQVFYIEYIGSGCYTIKVTSSQKLLTVKNGQIIQQEADESDLQKWIIQKADKNNNYAIRSLKTGQYINIYNNSMKDGTKIQVSNGKETNSQKFKLEEVYYNGIDVAKYQRNIDWSIVKTQIDFAMIRVGVRYWGSGKIAQDEYFTQNITNALKNNINCGVYFYSQAINEAEAIEEANFVLNAIKGYNIKYPVAIDTELTSEARDGRADNISTEQRTKAVKAFCKKIQDAGYTPIIYANKDWLNNNLNMKKLNQYDVWLAHYVHGAPENKSDYQGKYSIWQYSSSGSINGINGYVDMNICYKKYN